MENLVDFNYVNKKDKELTQLFISSTSVKKYILGINRLTKSVLKYIEVDGIIDDFTRIQSSRRKKEILNIKDVSKDSIILTVATGSPLEVKNTLDEMGFKHFNYLAFYKYSGFDLAAPPFILDFEDDFKKNRNRYKEVYDLLEDEPSKKVFEKVINFKISFDFDFMQGFTNNHEEQYFEKELIPNIKEIVFLDGGGYIGDTLPNIIKNFPDFKKIYLIEPNKLHINIAIKEFGDIKNIKFIQCGISDKKIISDIENEQSSSNNCRDNYQATSTDTIDNLIQEPIDFIKLDIEGAEQDAIDGAARTIIKYNPILAICIYHKAEDWYKIPQKILALNKDYKIYIRHYMEGIFETVMYFIPKNY